jgi:hypothetical protein
VCFCFRVQPADELSDRVRVRVCDVSAAVGSRRESRLPQAPAQGIAHLRRGSSLAGATAGFR